MKRLGTRHVAHIIEIATTEAGLPFMAMDFLDGHDLATELGLRQRLHWSGRSSPDRPRDPAQPRSDGDRRRRALDADRFALVVAAARHSELTTDAAARLGRIQLGERDSHVARTSVDVAAFTCLTRGRRLGEACTHGEPDPSLNRGASDASEAG